MRVSLIQLNVMAEDAIGACTIRQARFFRQRGDDVRVYTHFPCRKLPPDIQPLATTVTLGDLLNKRPDHFRLSDLYIFHYPGYYELLESMREIDRGTVIFYYHNVTPSELWGTTADQEPLVLSAARKSLVHYADACITDSPFNKQDLIDEVGYEPDLISVLPLAVPLDQFAPAEKDPDLVLQYGLEDRSVLLFVGRMAGNKRIDLLVEALAMVKTHFPKTRLLLVGDDKSSPAYREIAARASALAGELGIAPDVLFTGRVGTLQRYLSLADVYVTASLHEGFGVPLIEAMASGVPVVASRSGAMPWVLGEAGLVCEPGDAKELAARILQVLTDASLRQDLIRRGLDRVQTFSLDRYEAGFAEIVDKAVAYTLPEIEIRPGSWAGAKAHQPVASAELAPAKAWGLAPAEAWGSPEPKGGPANRGDEVPGNLGLSALRDVRTLAWVNPHLPIAWPSWPRGFRSKVVALLQKVMRRLLRWYINPLVEQQNRFNASVVQALGELAYRVQQIETEASQRALESETGGDGPSDGIGIDAPPTH